MYGYFCIGFIDFMLKDQILLVCINSFSSNEYEKKTNKQTKKTTKNNNNKKKNDKIILKYFHWLFIDYKGQDEKKCIICGKCRKFENLQYNTFFKKISVVISLSKCENEDEKILKEEEIEKPKFVKVKTRRIMFYQNVQ